MLILLLLRTAPIKAEAPDQSTLSSVVLVASAAPDGREATGTGFVVAPGLVLTNAHVVTGFSTFGAVPALSTALQTATLLWSDPEPDLALLSVPTLAATPLSLAVTIPPKGAKLWAVGFTGISLQFQAMNGKFDHSVTEGVLNTSYPFSWQQGGRPVLIIQHSAEISGGNSGGPLFDDCGRVVGVNTAGPNPEESNARVFLATAIAEAKQRLEALPQPVTLSISPQPCKGGVIEQDDLSVNTNESAASDFGDESNAQDDDPGNTAAPAGDRFDLISQQPLWVRVVGAVFLLALLTLIVRQFMIRNGKAVPQPAPETETEPLRSLTPDPAPMTLRRFRLTETKGDGRIVINPMLVAERQGFCIGRHPEFVDHVLSASAVSRRHIRLTMKGARIYVEDLNSSHGTMVDGRKIDPFNPVELQEGRVLQFAGRSFRLEVVGP